VAPKPGTGVAGHQLASPSDRRLAVRAACTTVLVVHRFTPSPVHPRTFAAHPSRPALLRVPDAAGGEVRADELA
jgi:hypothetical protein